MSSNPSSDSSLQLRREEEVIILNIVGKGQPEGDGVVDYCANLGKEVTRLGLAVLTYRVPWHSKGWTRSLFELFWASPARSSCLLVLHYTALQWSKRGLAGGFLAMALLARILRKRLVVVLHDTDTFSGAGLTRRARNLFQRLVMRGACRVSHSFVVTVPFEAVEKGLRRMRQGHFVPVGPNIKTNDPANVSQECKYRNENDGGQVVGVFGVSGGRKFTAECQDIANVMRCTADLVPDVELKLFGRGSLQAVRELENIGLGDKVPLKGLGVLRADELHAAMRSCTVLLFLRGAISTRRGSAVAAIACGRPIVAYKGHETCGPIVEAGVLLSPIGNYKSICHDLCSVLTNETLRVSLRIRSVEAYRRFFSWEVIGAQHNRVMREVLQSTR